MYENLSTFTVELEQENVRSWEERIDTMDIFPLVKTNSIPNTETNKYNRFIGFLKEWCANVMSGEYGKTPYMMGKCNTGRLIETFAHKEIPNNWWDTVMNVGKGQEVLHGMPLLKSDDEKENACAALMPAYRAVRDSFSKRWGLLSWIFNHDQYVAERDAMHALSGLMQTLTGKNQKDIDNLYREHKEAVPAGRTAAERKRYAADFRAAERKKLEDAQKDNSTRTRDRDRLRDVDISRDSISVELDDENSFEIEPQVNRGKNAERNIDNRTQSKFK